MCTALSYKTNDHYFGRNLDLEYSFNENVVVTPSNYPFTFRKVKSLETHYSMIGVAAVVDDYPLYYEATNDKGLSIAGLNFPENADYKPEVAGKDNVAPFEFIPWILAQCATLAEAKTLLERINLVAIPFSEQIPLSPLHWMISDAEGSLTVESVKEGLRVYENPIGLLTNNPPFDTQMFNLNNYMHISINQPTNLFSNQLNLKCYSRGMGAMGLPGDSSSMSRFVKGAFVKMNSVCGNTESESISQFFHILGAVAMQKGCVHMGNGLYEYTLYSSCCNTSKGIYYYKTYENSQITAVDMHKEDLSGRKLAVYPLVQGQQIMRMN